TFGVGGVRCGAALRITLVRIYNGGGRFGSFLSGSDLVQSAPPPPRWWLSVFFGYSSLPTA
ncbi:hypothetical protein A2U01_0069008, partial [Trifolium medium]|nr:hypothetical protein [Trifolium medium]